MLMVRGNVMGWAGEAYDLGISAEQIPLDRVVALARHTKKDLPEDLTATGTADGVFTVRKNPDGAPVWAGGGRTTQFALQSKVLKPDLELGEVEFSIPEAPERRAESTREGSAKPLPGSARLPLCVSWSSRSPCHSVRRLRQPLVDILTCNTIASPSTAMPK